MSTELFDRLKTYVTGNASSVSGANDAFIQDCLDEAVALVDNECGTSIDLVPMVVLHRAYIEVGADLYNRKAAPQGVSQFTAVDGSAIRLRRDPMEGIRPSLRQFLPGGFA